MAIELTVKTMKVGYKLNNGTTESGSVRTLNVSSAALNPSAFDGQKFINIAHALQPCLERNIYSVEQTIVNTISES